MAEASDFIVRLEGINLPDKVRSQIAGELQATVMREIAKLDTAGDLNARISRKEWLGLWLRSQRFDKEMTLQVMPR